MTATLSKYVPDERVDNAPPIPTDRPPTRAEVWARYHHLYFDLKGHKPTPLCTDKCQSLPVGELEADCLADWVWGYVYFYNFEGWRKQPDWVEGDPVIEAAVPTEPFWSGEGAKWTKIVKECFDRARRAA